MRLYAKSRDGIGNSCVSVEPVRSSDNADERINRPNADRFKRSPDKHKANKNAAHPHLLGSKNFKYFQKRFHVSTENII